MPKLLDRKARLLVPMLPGRGGERGLLAAEVAAEIEWAKARLIGADGYQVAAEAARRDPPRPPAEIAVLFERYERERRRRGLVDFDDLITWCAHALETDAEFQAAQRWRFRHVFVDEFQDANPAQFRLVRAWLGDRPDLCVVGDGDQAIYGFAGADASYLTAFGDHFRDAAVVRLGTNYRSSPQVVSAAASVLDDERRTSRDPQLATRGAAPRRPLLPERRGRSRGCRPRLAPRAPAGNPVVVGGGSVPDERPVGAVRGSARGAKASRSGFGAAGNSWTDPRSRSRWRRSASRPVRSPASRSPASWRP